MTDQEKHLDEQLTDALGNETPSADLVARIEMLTDGRMCDLLDRAIGPDTVGKDDQARVQRILAATSERPAVIGRIGIFSVAWRWAAAVAIVSSLFVIAWSLMQSQETPQPIDNEIALVELENELKTLSELDTAVAGEFEAQLAQVSAGLDAIAADDPWSASAEALVDRAADPVDWFQTPSTGTPTWF